MKNRTRMQHDFVSINSKKDQAIKEFEGSGDKFLDEYATAGTKKIWE